MNELNLTQEDIEPYKLQLRKLYTTLNIKREEHLQQYKFKSKELEEKIERLEERFINEEIKADLYEKFSDKYKRERQEFEAFVNMTTFSNSNFEKYIDRSLDFVVELSSLWASSNYKEKQELQKIIFPEGIYYSKKRGETRTTKINSLFVLIVRQKGVFEEKENRNLEVVFKNSGFVASPRIERGSRASEALILSIVLRGRVICNVLMCKCANVLICELYLQVCISANRHIILSTLVH